MVNEKISNAAQQQRIVAFHKKKNYIDADEMLQEYNECIQNNKCSYKLLKMFELIANRYSKSKAINFTSNQDRLVCVNYAVSEAWIKWNKFDSNRSENIFAFFTQMIKNDLKQHHEKLYRRSRNEISLDAVFANENR
jgi:hypothetical protein